MKAEIWAEVGDAVAGGGPTPKLEAALGNILAGRSNHFPRPLPPKRAQSDTSSDASSLQSKENRSPRRRLRRDLLPSDSDVSEPPTPQKPASDFFRRAARRAYAPAKEDPRTQLRRSLIDALLKCADATAAAQLIRNDGPAALNCERAELWVAKASTNEEHWSCDDDKALAEAAAVSCAARQGSSDRRAWPVTMGEAVVGVLEITGAPWPFDPKEGVELAEEIWPKEVERRDRVEGKVRRAPEEPTKEEREAHEALHAEHRAWCRHCVRGTWEESGT